MPYYNTRCVLFAASKPFTVSILKKQIGLPIFHTPAKRMFWGVVLEIEI